ncbi:MAG: hypothetical protein JWN48_2924 [Myxococcaceae bacterium]|nr:hypothetical protein [Myxococcaceae bacterium]
MNVQEFDTALSDLETRVDRLRALYENWFRGYEKMEPAVARKDVERRVYGLRKELPRNTALRFRYHQLYQRYTTLATYWQRTARQIEEGTYRLQLQRMKRRRVDDDVMRTNMPPPNDGEDAATIPPPSYELNLDETLDVKRLLEEADIDQVARAIDVPGPFSAPAAARSAAGSPAGRGLASSFTGKASGSLPSSSAASSSPAASPAASPPAGSAPAAAPPVAAPPTVTSARFARPSVANDVLAAKGLTPSRPAAVPPLSPPLPQVISAHAGPPTGQVPAPKPPPLKIPLPGAPATGTMPGLPRPRMSVQSPGTGTMAAPPPVPRPGAAPPAVPTRAAPPAVPGARPPAPPPANPPSAPARPSLPTGSRPASPMPAPSRPSLANNGAAQPAPEPPAGGLSEQRMRRIYDEYAAARRKNNEGDVRFEALQGSIQKMLPDLSKKHQGKQIDFEVVLKDGRVGLKPKAT